MLNRSKLAVVSMLAAAAVFALVACSEDTENPLGTTTPVPAEDTSTAANQGDTSDPEPTGPDITNGKQKFKGLGCSGCHNIDSSKLVGPGLAGISAKSDKYIRTSITDPAAELVDGYANLMPSTFANLKESDIDDLVAYLKTLN